MDEMVSHDDVYYILRAPLRHMAVHAVTGRRVASGLNESLDAILMAGLTNGDVLTRCGLPSRGVMRIVAGSTGQLAGRLLKAGGHAQSIAVMSDLEFVVVSRSRSVIKEQLVIRKGFSGTIGKHAPFESPQRIRQLRTGGL